MLLRNTLLNFKYMCADVFASLFGHNYKLVMVSCIFKNYFNDLCCWSTFPWKCRMILPDCLCPVRQMTVGSHLIYCLSAPSLR